VEETVDWLSGKLLSAKPKDTAARELGALGLKHLVAEAPPLGSAPTAALARRLAPALSEAVLQHAASAGATPTADVVADALDVLIALLTRCGALAAAAAKHEALAPALGTLLDVGKPAVRKRGTGCLGALAPWLPDAALHAQVDARLASLAATPAPSAEVLTGRVAAAGAILRSAGHRLSVQHLAALLPRIAHLCDTGAGDDDTKEACLHALEGALVHARPQDIGSAMAAITATSMRALSYDPNYGDDEGYDDEGGMGDGDGEAMAEEEEGDDDDGAYSDDEDVSWKVRRAAAKCVGAAVTACAAQDAAAGGASLGSLVASAGPLLCTRLVREREETVKLDVVTVTEGMLRALANTPAAGAQLAPLVSRACARMLASTGAASVRTKRGAFALLRELVTSASAVAGVDAAALAGFVAAVSKALGERGTAQTSALKMDALAFTKALLGGDEGSMSAPQHATALQPHLGSLVSALCTCATTDAYYRTAADALRCCGCCVPLLSGDAARVRAVFEACTAKLAALEADTEVRDAALTTLGTLLASAPGALAAHDARAGVNILLEKCKVEATRLSAVKAVHRVCASVQPGASPALAPAAQGVAIELTALLRKAARPLRYAAVEALGDLVAAHAASVPPADIANALCEAAPLINEADLALASGALVLARHALLHAGGAAPVVEAVKSHIQPAALRLLPSPLVGGASAVALRRFFGALGTVTRGTGPDFSTLVTALLAAPEGANAGKHAATAASACIGGAAAGAGGAPACAALAQELLGKAAKSTPSPATLLALGELGRRCDLSAHSAAVMDVLSRCFDAPGEEVKEAAATSLGHISQGALAALLPLLLAAITADTKHRYQLLQALRVVLTPAVEETPAGGTHDSDDVTKPPAGGPAALAPHQVDEVCKVLFSLADADEDGVRAVVSDCLGCAMVAHPATLVPQLRAHFTIASTTSSPLCRAVCVHAVRCALVESPVSGTAALAGQPADDVLACLADADHRVRHAAAACLAAAAHYPACHATLVLPRLNGCLPPLLALCSPRPELVRIVDLGPFKMTVDDGLECRKAAFECVDAMLTVAPALLSASDATVAALVGGLADTAYDVKVTAHGSLARLCGCAGAAITVGPHVEKSAEALEKTILAKLKTDAVKQEVDRNDDLVRSAMRCVHALARLQGAMDSSPKLAALVTRTIGGTPALAAKYKAEEANVAVGGGSTSAGVDAMDTA